MELAATIKNLNKTIKMQIAKAQKSQLDMRLIGTNLKSFWKADLEGKNKREEIELEIDGVLTQDPKPIANELRFFVNKVNKLSNGAGAHDYSMGPSGLTITTDEIVKAAKKLKPKLCQGEDGLPMRLIKDIAINSLEVIRKTSRSLQTHIYLKDGKQQLLPSCTKVVIKINQHSLG